MKGGKAWFFHMMAGAVLFFLLTGHIALMHFSPGTLHEWNHPENPLSWEQVLTRSKDLFSAIIYTLFIGIGLFHGFYGLFGILTESNTLRSYRRFIAGFLIVLGILLFLYGTITTWYAFFYLK